MYIYHIFFIHSSFDGWLACFHNLAVVINDAINIGVNISFQISASIFLDVYPELELPGFMVFLFLIFWEASILFSIKAVAIYRPTNIVPGFLFLHILVNTFISFLVRMITILTLGRLYLIVFKLAGPWWLMMLSIFSGV